MAPPIPKPIDLTGQRFGRLTVLRLSEERTRLRRALWECRCDCGASSLVRGDGLRGGSIVSCGCHARDRLVARLTRHGHARSPEYAAWQQMRYRCLNPGCKAYRNYGGRGITISREWDSFEQFYADMGPRPSARHSIDRIDNDGPYSPENCRWARPPVQLRNTRRNNVLTHNGRSMTVTDWAAELGIAPPTLTARLERGWSVEAALSTPPDEGAKNHAAHRMIEFRGETRSLAEWTHRLGGSSTAILCRLKAGWSVERALTTPIRRQR